MRIYFAMGVGGNKSRRRLIEKHSLSSLYSYFTLITDTQGYGNIDRFNELLKFMEKNNVKSK